MATNSVISLYFALIEKERKKVTRKKFLCYLENNWSFFEFDKNINEANINEISLVYSIFSNYQNELMKAVQQENTKVYFSQDHPTPSNILEGFFAEWLDLVMTFKLGQDEKSCKDSRSNAEMDFFFDLGVISEILVDLILDTEKAEHIKSLFWYREVGFKHSEANNFLNFALKYDDEPDLVFLRVEEFIKEKNFAFAKYVLTDMLKNEVYLKKYNILQSDFIQKQHYKLKKKILREEIKVRNTLLQNCKEILMKKEKLPNSLREKLKDLLFIYSNDCNFQKQAAEAFQFIKETQKTPEILLNFKKCFMRAFLLVSADDNQYGIMQAIHQLFFAQEMLVSIVKLEKEIQFVLKDFIEMIKERLADIPWHQDSRKELYFLLSTVLLKKSSDFEFENLVKEKGRIGWEGLQNVKDFFDMNEEIFVSNPIFYSEIKFENRIRNPGGIPEGNERPPPNNNCLNHDQFLSENEIEEFEFMGHPIDYDVGREFFSEIEFSNLKNDKVDNQRLYRCCCLDGGGIKGLAHLFFLSELEFLTGKPVYELFEMFAGTSIGGIFSLAFALKISASDLLKDIVGPSKNKIFHNNNSFDNFLSLLFRKVIFQNIGLQQILDKYFQGKNLGDLHSDVLITSAKVVNKQIIPIIFYKKGEKYGVNKVIQDRNNEKVITFKNDNDFMDLSFQLTKIGLATSAAVPILKKVIYNENPLIQLIDGGFCFNNPSYVLCSFLKKEHQYQNNSFNVISLGFAKEEEDGLGGRFQKQFVFWFSGNEFLQTAVKNIDQVVERHSEMTLEEIGDVNYERITHDFKENITMYDVAENTIEKMLSAEFTLFQKLSQNNKFKKMCSMLNEIHRLDRANLNPFLNTTRMHRFPKNYEKLNRITSNFVIGGELRNLNQALIDFNEFQHPSIWPFYIDPGGVSKAAGIGHLPSLKIFKESLRNDWRTEVTKKGKDSWTTFHYICANGEIGSMIFLVYAEIAQFRGDGSLELNQRCKFELNRQDKEKLRKSIQEIKTGGCFVDGKTAFQFLEKYEKDNFYAKSLKKFLSDLQL